MTRARAPEITAPTAAKAADDPTDHAVFQCMVCERKFKKAMIAARHFNSAHHDLKDEKDSWRLHVEEVTN